MKKILSIILSIFILSNVLLGHFSTVFAAQPAKLPTPQLTGATDPDSYAYFNDYKLKNLGIATDSTLTAKFGSALKFNDAAFWEYNSYNSHAVSFATTLPSVAVLEYGATASYGSRTQIQDSYYIQHTEYLKNLAEGTTYHYRIVVQDPTGQIIASPDRTFTTKTFTNETKVTNAMIPLQITKPGKYVIVEDITSSTLGINIKSNDVSIDMNGHTLIYDNGTPIVNSTTWDGYAYNEQSSMGIRAGLWNFKNLQVYNGIIKQGKNNGMGYIGVGYNPLYFGHMTSDPRNEVAGVTLEWTGDSVAGLKMSAGKTHHNVLYDKGHVIDDRHMAIRALATGVTDYNEVLYNSVRAARHRGIEGGGLVKGNEVYANSFDTNSFAISNATNAKILDNYVFGMGYNPLGIGWGDNTVMSGNTIYLRCYAPTMRSEEYARFSGVAGVRYTDYNSDDDETIQNLLFENNTVVLKGDNGCTQARGIWTSSVASAPSRSLIYRNNTVKVEAMPGNHKTIGHEFYPGYGGWNGTQGDVNTAFTTFTSSGTSWTLATDGSAKVPDSILVENNHFLGNVNLITLGEGYGNVAGVRFIGNTLEKIDHDTEWFDPIRIGFWYWNTFNNELYDTTTVGFTLGAPDYYGGTGYMEITYGITHKAQFIDGNKKPLVNKKIVLSIDGGARKLTITTGAKGYATFDIPTHQHLKPGEGQGGKAGTPTETLYKNYKFLQGSESSALYQAASDVKATNTIMIGTPASTPDPGDDKDNTNTSDNNDKDDNSDLEMPDELPQTGFSIFADIVSYLGIATIVYLAVLNLRLSKR